MLSGRNLNLFARLVIHAYPLSFSSELKSYPVSEDIHIPKSKSVEDILPRLGYKNVASMLAWNILNKSIDMLNAAWKSYSTGDMDDVLVKRRKALEELEKQVIAAGFVIQELRQIDMVNYIWRNVQSGTIS